MQATRYSARDVLETMTVSGSGHTALPPAGDSSAPRPLRPVDLLLGETAWVSFALDSGARVNAISIEGLAEFARVREGS